MIKSFFSKRVKILLVFIALASILFYIFSDKKVTQTIFELEDIELLSLSKKAKNSVIDQEKESKEFLKKYFLVWEQDKISISKEDALWGFSIKDVTRYLENFSKIDSKWLEKEKINSNFEEFNTLNKKAITIKNTNIRVFPTISPIFKNPQTLGEGFPFDYNQNSLLKINSPLMVSHLSKDKAWAFIESGFVYGWIKIDDIAFVDDKFINEFKNENYFIAIKEDFAIYNPNFIEYIKASTIFPKKENRYLVATKDRFMNARIDFIDIKDDYVSSFPLEFNLENRVLALKEFLNEPYGWGGLLTNRDCSSFTQDYFSIFGKLIARNSKTQTSFGEYIDLSDKSNEDKKRFIKNSAKPFSTLVYLQGHIMLYIGNLDGEPLLVHNIWSIKLKDKDNNEKRQIVGKTVISTLEIGKELEEYDSENSVLSRVLGVTIF
ncbi:hypothetical protein CRU94_08175 [Arcobacter sp. AHV-9/2010]|uniref:C40 family peptidase n=1 Tax=Arcobacter sp. AHV-9/2010 TaxID=2021861 RepID=UPI00100C2150|nr:SH3 domain-containing C40 family peptidase [Arcobacter sp. CECT 9299]RXJ94733.1 hypothetical protein CRU94_08175 [Arcobacter sp. CECT 9299]